MPPKQGSVTEADDPVLAVIASTSPNQSLLDDAVIDSISCDMSRKAFNTRLKALARISPKNAATIVEHILGEKTTEHKGDNCRKQAQGTDLADDT